MDRKIIEEFWQRRGKIDDPDMATQFKKDDSLQYDIELIKRYMPRSSEVLELGCGTCRVTNELEPLVSEVTIVDREPSLMKFCKESHKITKVLADIVGYKDAKLYDLILVFGVMNYLSFEEANEVYGNCFEMLKDTGLLLVKHACGVQDDVIVNKYSETIGDWYYAEYRHFVKEKSILESKGFAVTIVDIYPEHLNLWQNTHYYAFIGKKEACLASG